MPKVSRESATLDNHGPVEDRHEDIDDYAINFLTFHQTMDATPLLRGLPGDRCICAHWGYVFQGKLTFQFEDHEEVFEAGDAFYVPPGHSPIVEEGTEYLQFSPSKDLRAVTDVLVKNAQAMGVI